MAQPVVLVVDVANVMGSRPDGWWRDRAGAATRLLTGLPGLAGREVDGPDGRVRIERIVAVVEGAARAAGAPEGVEVVRAPAAGDDAIVDAAGDAAASGARVLVVTADRGLRARLVDVDALIAGPGWLNGLLGR
ncbi:hypothetical protein BCL57_000189 [Agromyces flavus]|uniref:YacP-like NYN domain-containing protein n=1 Tax=Agromyces flavus TaxID=589382 RepID=A0A1H1W0A4_9MICO|nr:hypothetical protein [Agromyces flavus]MCP2366047.1 hypothetical protein [Agromyces flavus]GGI43893.1 hypothetical protein GCM10010932_01870 [Agromyces flavus]SDS90130.1 hypothetical protein SAMN04489721_2120 [Agromyces flavus]